MLCRPAPIALLFAASLLFANATCALVEREAVCEDGAGVGELFGVTSCDVCASQSCCEESTACAADEGCADLMACHMDCPAGDGACFAECRKTIAHDEGVALALSMCVAQRCEEAACPIPERASTCAAAGEVPDVFGDYACDLCIRNRLCDAATSCAGNAACAARIACMSECTGPDLNPACFDLCRADGEFGVGDAQLFAEVARQCRSECDVGTAFECVGQFSWPTTDQPRVKVTHQALDRTMGNAPFVGLEVVGCASQSGPCNVVSDPEISETNGDGLVVVNVPTNNGFDPVDDNIFSGFRGYLRWELPEPNPEVWATTILTHMRPEYRDRLADEIAPFASGGLLTSLTEIVAATREVPNDPTRGVLVGGMVDCHGTVEFFAPDIEVSVEGADEITEYVYVAADMTFLDFEVTATTTAGQFVVVNVPAGASPKVTLRHVPTDTIVAETNVNIVAGEFTVLAAWPQTK